MLDCLCRVQEGSCVGEEVVFVSGVVVEQNLGVIFGAGALPDEVNFRPPAHARTSPV